MFVSWAVSLQRTVLCSACVRALLAPECGCLLAQSLPSVPSRPAFQLSDPPIVCGFCGLTWRNHRITAFPSAAGNWGDHRCLAKQSKDSRKPSYSLSMIQFSLLFQANISDYPSLPICVKLLIFRKCKIITPASVSVFMIYVNLRVSH
jgi:hypothetical protein